MRELVRELFACPACADLYLTQREADLCTPREQWATRYALDVRGVYISPVL